MNETTILAEQAAGLTYDDLPAEVVRKAKLLLLDQLGCQLAFATLPWGKAAVRYTAAKHSAGRSTVAYYGLRANAEDAAFCNGVFGHGFEMDDVEMQTTSHPAVCVVPALLAVGDEQASSGREVLTALVAGYETFLRLAHAADAMRHRFFHCTAVAGAFGAAATAGQLLGFDALVMRDALAIATTQASGNTEYTCSGGTVKRTLGALGAYAGVRSALLAQAGITGSAEALEGRKSLLKGICEGDPEMTWLSLPFAERFLTLDVGFKPYCCCAAQHTVIDAAEALRARGVDAAAIESITILQLPRETGNVGQIIHPEDVIQSQFCGRFACALRLVKGGNGYYDYTMENINDPAIVALIDKIGYESDAERAVLAHGDGPARVTVRLADGTVMEETVPFAKGTTQNPLSDEELVAKFRDLTSRALAPAQADRVIEVVMGLEDEESVTRLTSLLVA